MLVNDLKLWVPTHETLVRMEIKYAIRTPNFSLTTFQYELNNKKYAIVNYQGIQQLVFF